MARPKHRHWYNKRTHKDAPTHLADEAMTKFGAWAEGYNDAVRACIAEMDESARKEGLLDDDSWRFRVTEEQIQALTEIIINQSAEDVEHWIDHSVREGVELAIKWLAANGFLTTVTYNLNPRDFDEPV